MKRKTMVLTLGLVFAILLFLYLAPLLIEFQKIHIALFGSCIGTGCRSFSGSSTSSIGGVYCEGYELGFLCLSDVKKYCMYINPLLQKECICDTIKTYKGENIKYEFMCTTDIATLCKKVEENLEDKEREYLYSNYSGRIDIFNNRRLWYGPNEDIGIVSIKNVCNVFCWNCNSSLCERGNICEYSRYPPNQNL